MNLVCLSLRHLPLGSKKALLEDFAQRYLSDGGVVVVNGFFPGLTPRQVLAGAAAAFSSARGAAADTTVASSSAEVLLDIVRNATSPPPAGVGVDRPSNPPPGTAQLAAVREPRRLYIILHNIDGQQLRSPEAQALLGELAAMPRVHLVASVDHVNAPLLWSKREAAR